MRYLLIAAVLGLCASSALATVDPDPDQFGIYFDTDAEVTCTNAALAVPFSAYFIVTNPSSPEIWGVEFSFCTQVIGGGPSMIVRTGEQWAPGVSPPIIQEDWCLVGNAVVCSSPPLQVGANVVIVRFDFIVLGDVEVEFFLGPTAFESIPDGLPAYLGVAGVLPLGVSSGDPSLPVAQVNGAECRIVPADESTFGSLKCLFR